MRPPEGGWIETGQWRGKPVRWWHNPRHLLPPPWRRVVDLWIRSRGGMGVGWLPAAGGVNDQPAWLMAAFGVLNAEDCRIEEAKRPAEEA